MAALPRPASKPPFGFTTAPNSLLTFTVVVAKSGPDAARAWPRCRSLEVICNA
jgi:hypothetical protein